MDEYDIESILDMYEDDYVKVADIKMSNKIPLLDRDNFNTPDLEQSPDSFLRPGETLEDFDVTFRRPNAQGGMQQLVQPNADGSRPGYSGEYPINISKEGNSFRVKLLNGKRKSVKDLDAAIKLLKSDGQTVKYLGVDRKKVLNWIKSQTEPITTDDIAKYIADNNLSVKRGNITNIIKNNPEYEGKVNLVKEYRANFLNKDGTIIQGTVDEITKMINNSKDFPTMQSIAKKLKYKGTIKNVINQWSAQTGNDIPFERFRVHTYRDTAIAEKIIKAFDAQGENPNIAKLARQFQNEMPGVNSFKTAKNQVRRILVDYADYEPRPNEPKSANEMSSYKIRREKIALALKRMGDTTIKGQMDEILYNKNQEYVKLANENPNKILNDKKLRFALETTVDVDTGEFRIRNDGKGLSDNEILERAKRGDLFTEDHITEVRTAKTAPKKSGEGVKLIKGFNIEYPINKQAVTVNFNQSFLPNAQKYLTENPNGKNVQKIVNVLNDYGLQIKVGDKTYGTAEKVAWDSKTKTSPRYNSNFNVFDSTDILPKNKNNVEQSLKKTLQDFEKLGCGQAAGGRILFAKGVPSLTKCAQKGVTKLENGLKNGFKNADDAVLARGILKSGKFLKDAVSLRGLFGPAALGFTVAAEAGLVGYDMLSSGKSFREAIGDSLFNYVVKGTDYEIDSEEEFIKRLKNIKTGPSELRDFSDEEIGKMQYFKENLKDMGRGFDLYKKLEDLEGVQEIRDEKGNVIVKGKAGKILDNQTNQAIDSTFFSDNAFNLDAERDAIRADIQDYNRTGTPNRITNYLLSDKAAEGADALAKANLLVEQDRLQDAGTGKLYQSPKGDKKRLDRSSELKYELEKMYNPTEPTGYENFIPSQMSYIMSNIKNEPSNNYGLFGPARFMEGGIASLNVNKK